MRTIRLTNFGFAFFCLFLSNAIASGQPPAQTQSTQSQKGYCQASSSDQATIYFSNVFESNVPYSLIASGGIENLFGAYLKQSYGYNSSPVTPVVCEYLQSAAASEESKKQKQERYTMMGKKIVETRWKLSPQQAATLPTPTVCDLGHGETGPCPQPGSPAAANPNAIQYEICRAVTSVRTGGKYTTYFSGIMPRANINEAEYSAAFAAFLAKKYGVQYVTPECGASRSQAEARSWMEEGWWKVNPNFSSSVQTGWTYSPASPPTSPASPAPTASNTQITSYTVCVAGDASMSYVSAAFAVTKMDDPAWRNAFAQFLAQKYSYEGGGVGCNNMDLEHAPTFLKNRIAGLRANKRQVVETGWTYGSFAAAPTANAAPPQPAKNVPATPIPPTKPPTTTPQSPASQPSTRPSLYGVCQAIADPHTAYFSAPFQVPNGNSSQWEQAFAQFLQKKYQYTGNVGCVRLGSLSDANAYIKQLDNAISPTKKIVETRWEFK